MILRCICNTSANHSREEIYLVGLDGPSGNDVAVGWSVGEAGGGCCPGRRWGDGTGCGGRRSRARVAAAMRPGGAATAFKTIDRGSFSHPSANMSLGGELDFRIGDGIFRKVWVSAPTHRIATLGYGLLAPTTRLPPRRRFCCVPEGHVITLPYCPGRRHQQMPKPSTRPRLRTGPDCRGRRSPA